MAMERNSFIEDSDQPQKFESDIDHSNQPQEREEKNADVKESKDIFDQLKGWLLSCLGERRRTESSSARSCKFKVEELCGIAEIEEAGVDETNIDQEMSSRGEAREGQEILVQDVEAKDEQAGKSQKVVVSIELLEEAKDNLGKILDVLESAEIHEKCRNTFNNFAAKTDELKKEDQNDLQQYSKALFDVSEFYQRAYEQISELYKKQLGQSSSIHGDINASGAIITAGGNVHIGHKIDMHLTDALHEQITEVLTALKKSAGPKNKNKRSQSQQQDVRRSNESEKQKSDDAFPLPVNVSDHPLDTSELEDKKDGVYESGKELEISQVNPSLPEQFNIYNCLSLILFRASELEDEKDDVYESDKELEISQVNRSLPEQFNIYNCLSLILRHSQADIQTLKIEERLKLYIPSKGLYRSEHALDHSFDLRGRFDAFLKNPTVKTFVILGQGGSGKSLFTLTIFKHIFQKCRPDDFFFEDAIRLIPKWLPIYIPLKYYPDTQVGDLINVVLLECGLNAHDIEALKTGIDFHGRVLFILDGYNELGYGVCPNLTEALIADWPNAKLLINGRIEHFQNDAQHALAFALHDASGRPIYSSFERYYLAHFSQEDIENYIEKYEGLTPPSFAATVEEYKDGDESARRDSVTYAKLVSLPGLLPLLNNPLLLNLTLRILHHSLPNNNGRDLTRADIYRAFLNNFFATAIRTIPHAFDYGSGPPESFAEELAFMLFTHQALNISDQYSAIWQFFIHPDHATIRGIYPFEQRANKFSFIYKSVYEYFVALYLWKALIEKPIDQACNDWNMRSLLEEPAILDFLIDFAKFRFRSDLAALERHANQALNPDEIVQSFPQLRLLHMIRSSRNSSSDFSIAATNAIIFLNYTRTSFSGIDFSDIQIPGADLSSSVCDGTNFQRSNLTRVNFRNAWLNNSQFQNAVMDGVRLGEYPILEFGSLNAYFSKDGNLIFHRGGDIHIYHMATQTLLKALKDYTGGTIISLSPNGMYLVAYGGIYELQDKTLQVWDVGRSLCQWKFESEAYIAFSPDSKYLASADMKAHTLSLWHVNSGERERTVKYDCIRDPEYFYQKGIIFSPDNERVAFFYSNNDDGELWLWEINSDLCKRLEGHPHGVTSITFSPDGMSLVSGGCTAFIGERDPNFEYAGEIRIWDVSSGACKRVLRNHNFRIASVVFSPDGKWLASGGGGGRDSFGFDNPISELQLWSVDSGRCHILEGHTSGVTNLVFSPDSNYLASGGQGDNTIRLWHVQTGLCERVFEGYGDQIAFNLDGTCLILSGCMLWDIGTVHLLDVLHSVAERFQNSYSGSIRSVAFSPDGKILASGGDDGILRLWNVEHGICERILEAHNDRVVCVAFSTDAKYIAMGSTDKTVHLWHVKSDVFKQVFEGHTKQVNSIAFSLDNKYLVSGSRDRTVRLWNIKSGTCERVLQGHTNEVASVACSPNGRYLVSGSWDKTRRLWDIRTGQCLCISEGHTGWRNSLVFNHDGTRLASGSWDKTLRLWNVQMGTCERVLAGHAPYVTSVAFSSDGTYLVSSGKDKTLRCWDVASGVELVCITLNSVANHCSWHARPNGSYLATAHENGSICCWDVKFTSISAVQNTVSFVLVWSSKQQTLNAANSDINGVKGLSTNDAMLLKQRRAVGEPMVEPSEAANIVGPIGGVSRFFQTTQRNAPHINTTSVAPVSLPVAIDSATAMAVTRNFTSG
ncbi:MAG: WD-repeat protein [Gammaproteobacteria bacterium]|nr:WD-repeat protein [Gammaproteobacteria bacterium]